MAPRFFDKGNAAFNRNLAMIEFLEAVNVKCINEKIPLTILNQTQLTYFLDPGNKVNRMLLTGISAAKMGQYIKIVSETLAEPQFEALNKSLNSQKQLGQKIEFTQATVDTESFRKAAKTIKSEELDQFQEPPKLR